MEIQTKGKQTRARASERYQMKDFAIRLSFIFFFAIFQLQLSKWNQEFGSVPRRIMRILLPIASAYSMVFARTVCIHGAMCAETE